MLNVIICNLNFIITISKSKINFRNVNNIINYTVYRYTELIILIVALNQGLHLNLQSCRKRKRGRLACLNMLIT